MRRLLTKYPFTEEPLPAETISPLTTITHRMLAASVVVQCANVVRASCTKFVGDEPRLGRTKSAARRRAGRAILGDMELVGLLRGLGRRRMWCVILLAMFDVRLANKRVLGEVANPHDPMAVKGSISSTNGLASWLTGTLNPANAMSELGNANGSASRPGTPI